MAITFEGASSPMQTLSNSVSQTGSLNKQPVVHLDHAVARRGFNAGGDGAVDCFCRIFSVSFAGFGLIVGTIFATAAVGIATRNITQSLATFAVGLILTVSVVVGLAKSKMTS